MPKLEVGFVAGMLKESSVRAADAVDGKRPLKAAGDHDPLAAPQSATVPRRLWRVS